MSNESHRPEYDAGSYIGVDRPSGAAPDTEAHPLRHEVRGYLTGLALAVLLTIASFWVAQTDFMPSLSMGAVALDPRIAQHVVHRVRLRNPTCVAIFLI